MGARPSVQQLPRRNARPKATGEFVANVVPSSLAPLAWAMLADHGADRVENSGLTLESATTVGPPLVAECVAHFECRHERTVDFGGIEVFIFGRVVAADIDVACLVGDPLAAYGRLAASFFLEDGMYAGLGSPVAAPATD